MHFFGIKIVCSCLSIYGAWTSYIQGEFHSHARSSLQSSPMVAATVFKYSGDDDKLDILGLDMLVGARQSRSHRYCTYSM